MRQMTSILIFLTSLLASALCSFERAQAETENAVNLRRELFVEHYLDRVRAQPELLLSQLSFIVDAYGTNEGTNVYRSLIQDQSLSAAVKRFNDQLPSIGIGISVPFAIGLKGSVGYDLRPLVAGIVRHTLGVSDDAQLRERLRDLTNLNDDVVRNIGALTYDSYNSFGNVAYERYHPLYGMASEYDRNLPSPDGPPSQFIDAAPPLLRVWLRAKVQSGDPRALNDWDAFATAFGNQLITSPQSAASNYSPASVALTAGNDFRRMLTDSRDLRADLPRVLSKNLGTLADPDFMVQFKAFLDQNKSVQSQDGQHFSQDLAAYKDLMGSISRITQIAGDSQSQRAATIVNGVISFAYYAQSFEAAQTGLQSFTASFGAVTSIFAIFGAVLSTPQEAQTARALRAILQNQQLLLERVNFVSQQVLQTRLAVAGVQNQLIREGDRITFQLNDLQRELARMRELELASRDEILQAISRLEKQPAGIAAAGLREEATSGARTDLSVSVQGRRAQSVGAIMQLITQEAATRKLNLDEPLSEKPWIGARSIAEYLVNTADQIKAILIAQPSIKIPQDVSIAMEAVDRLRSDLKATLPDPDSFLTGTSLLVDAVVRFPPAAIRVRSNDVCTLAQATTRFYSDILQALPIAFLALAWDYRDALENWNQAFLEATEHAIPIADFGYTGSRLLSSILMRTNATHLPSLYNCAIDKPVKCEGPWADGGHEYSNPNGPTSWEIYFDRSRTPPVMGDSNLLVALGLTENHSKYIRHEATRRQYYFYQRGTGCFRVTRVAPWTQHAHSLYGAVLTDTDPGEIVADQEVCRSYIMDTGSQQENHDLFWHTHDAGPAKLDEFVWSKYFYPDIDRLYGRESNTKLTDDQIKNHQIVANILGLEERQLRTGIREYFDAMPHTYLAFLESIDNISRETQAVYLAASLVQPRCQSELNSQLMYLLSNHNGSLEHLSLGMRRLVREQNYAAVERILLEARSNFQANSPQASPISASCNIAPGKFDEAVSLLSLLQRYSGDKSRSCVDAQFSSKSGR